MKTVTISFLLLGMILISTASRAQELDPFSIIINAESGLPYLYARRYDEAFVQFQKAIEMDPNFAFAHICRFGEAHRSAAVIVNLE